MSVQITGRFLKARRGQRTSQAGQDDDPTGEMAPQGVRAGQVQPQVPHQSRTRRDDIFNNPEDTDFTRAPRASEERPIVPKAEKTKELILSSLSEHFMFTDLDPSEMLDIVNVMQPLSKGAGETIIHQGEAGNEFYVLEEGHCEVFVDDAMVKEYHSGGSFGELALMYDAPRAATVRCTGPCKLWTLDLRTFRRLLATTASAQMMNRCEFLRRARLLRDLSNDQISKIAGALETASFQAGAYIIRQGDPGGTFYIIQDGSVRCTQNKAGTSDVETELLTLRAGDYFGEMALMLDEPRHANCIAQTNCICLTLDAEQFAELLAPVQSLLSRMMRIRILKSVPLLSRLTENELDILADAMRVQLFDEGDYVIRQGERGTRFYIINEGEVLCKKNNSSDGSCSDLIRLGPQEYFGERALLKNEPRGADVVATSNVECLVLERDDFERLLGSVQEVLTKEMRRREAIAPDEAKAPHEPRVMATNFQLEDLEQIKTVGTGTFGRVKLVKDKTSGRVCALKCMQKAQIVQSHQERNIMNEKNILLECRHPLILELIQTFNTRDQLFMLMELVQGGELWSYIYEKLDLIPRTGCGGFTSRTSMFYAGCVISAFEHVHSLGVAYRDLKPENLLLGPTGFVKLIDFGFAKHIPFKKGDVMHAKSFTLCGTPEYLSPELVLSKGHDKSVDYWALGCLVYELMVGRTPFQDDHQPEIFRKIIHSERCLVFPRGFDSRCADLVRRLLAQNPAFRLGNLMGGVEDIKTHPWFSEAGFEWDKLLDLSLQAPYVPVISNPLDTSNFDEYSEDNYVQRYTGDQSIFAEF